MYRSFFRMFKRPAKSLSCVVINRDRIVCNFFFFIHTVTWFLCYSSCLPSFAYTICGERWTILLATRHIMGIFRVRDVDRMCVIYLKKKIHISEWVFCVRRLQCDYAWMKCSDKECEATMICGIVRSTMKMFFNSMRCDVICFNFILWH